MVPDGAEWLVIVASSPGLVVDAACRGVVKSHGLQGREGRRGSSADEREKLGLGGGSLAVVELRRRWQGLRVGLCGR